MGKIDLHFYIFKNGPGPNLKTEPKSICLATVENALATAFWRHFLQHSHFMHKIEK